MVLTKRVSTALVAIPVLAGIITWGSDIIFFPLVVIVSVLALNEFYQISLPSHRYTKIVAVLLGILCLIAIFYYQNLSPFSSLNPIDSIICIIVTSTTLFVFLLLLYQFIVYPKNILWTYIPLIVGIGIIYICIYLSYLILLRGGVGGEKWVLFTLMVVWGGDSGSYFVGNWKGKHKLSPTTSPNKTVEGALGGVSGSLLTALVANWLFLKQLSAVHCICLAIGTSVMGQLGDLCESTFKRIHGIKDSGSLLPGHGGILDRIDSLLFVAPFVYYYKILLL